MEITDYVIPTYEFNPGPILGEPYKIHGAEILIYKPESFDLHQDILIIPGFGHTPENIGQTFKDLAGFLAQSTKMTTAITVAETSREKEIILGNIIQVPIQTAITDALNLVKKPVHIMAFSRNSEPLLNLVHDMILRDNDKKRQSVSSSINQILSITLCAPVPWKNLVTAFNKMGRLTINRHDDNGYVEIGSRKIRTSPFIMNSRFRKTNADDITKLREAISVLKQNNIPLNIVCGKSDPFLEQSEIFARLTAQNLETVVPISNRSNNHDFEDQNLRKRLLEIVKVNKIVSSRVFTPHVVDEERAAKISATKVN